MLVRITKNSKYFKLFLSIHEVKEEFFMSLLRKGHKVFFFFIIKLNKIDLYKNN